MKNRISLLSLFITLLGSLPVSFYAGFSSGTYPFGYDIKHTINGQRVPVYDVEKKEHGLIPVNIQPVNLIELLNDIIELRPKANSWILGSKRHYYEIMCKQDADDPTYPLHIYAEQGFFIIPDVGTVIGTIGGNTYRLEKVVYGKKPNNYVFLAISINN